MKLSNETLTVLKNFASLNSGIQFKQGNSIKTISTGKNVLAMLYLKDSLPQDFCVYDLNQFLGMYTINKDTKLILMMQTSFSSLEVMVATKPNIVKHKKI